MLMLIVSLVVMGGYWAISNKQPTRKEIGLVYTPKTQVNKDSILSSPVLKRGIDYLVSAQFENGGWGAGTHHNQGERNALNVAVDPATTAFAAMALLRTGSTLKTGPYAENLTKALNYLLEVVETSPEEGFALTNIKGTQPQVKLGQNIDASMCVQFFLRMTPLIEENSGLYKRVKQATEKCLVKVQAAQSEDGSMVGGGWAPVLQSAMANSALELAYTQGVEIDEKALKKARDYQKQNIDKSGRVKSERGAGVALYSVAGANRATSQEVRRAKELIKDAKIKGNLDDSDGISRETLKKTGISDEEVERLADAYEANRQSVEQLQDDRVLAGFGNNGGEEFLSFMMTSESMLISGGNDWTQWKQKMNTLLQKIQNENGSWNGHHCITSPVFCTAACVLALSVENDKEFLLAQSQEKE